MVDGNTHAPRARVGAGDRSQIASTMAKILKERVRTARDRVSRGEPLQARQSAIGENIALHHNSVAAFTEFAEDDLRRRIARAAPS
jgi:hypothetical protein